jgi:signal transduction histidine kinase/CheY-like chemotaxis protein
MCYDTSLRFLRHIMADPHHQPRLQLTVRVLAAIATGIAVLATLGYIGHRTRLITLLPGWQGMSLLTAASIIFVAVPLWERRPGRFAAVTRSLPWFSMATMLAVLFSHGMYRADVISPWFAETLLGLPAALSGRVSIATALCLLALSGAMMANRLRGRHAIVAVEVASNAALLVAGAALLGYAYRVSDLYGIYVFNSMSLQSALSIACLAAASLVGQPNTRLGMALRSPSLSVSRMRRMLALTALPAVLGWILLRMGGPIAHGNGAAMALLVSATSVPMFYLLLENAHALELLDRERAAQHDREHQLMSELQLRLDEQTAELAAIHRREVESLARAERGKRSEMIAQLTGSIAHDFNNLLMIIGGCAQLLKLRVRSEPAIEPLVDKVTGTVARAARLTGQLSAFSRTQRLQTLPVHIDSVVRAALAEVGTGLRVGISLSTDLDAEKCTVLSDSAQLQLALVHLIRNSEEAIGDSGTLRISTACRSNDGATQVAIQVVDTGCGMTQEQMDSAVEPFFTTKRGNHHGLGLAQVNSVVQQASGLLHIDSTPDRGTRVELVFPCIQAPAAMPSSGTGSARNPAGSQRMLVIDDDDEVRAVIVALLRQMHYDVIEAGDGETGLRLLARHEPALAIIDYLMPGMNGAEVAQRAQLHSPGLPIIFISGYSDSSAIAAIPNSRLLRKPILLQELAQAVTDVLQLDTVEPAEGSALH